ncbi:MAG TPA: AAA family ATPase, partial [Dehalococcoidia bacterium]|nr:AAA family ATPase [Dehalococcoidia bacterium]
LPEAEVESLLPRDIVTLARMFPAMREVRPIADARQRIGPVPESLESRRRAFAAFRELLARLSDRRPLVLFIDDLQWGDLDSSSLLASILEVPDPPAILLIICYRSEEVSNVYLRDLLPTHKVLTPTGDARELVVDALSPAEAAQLAQTLVGAGSIDQVITPEAILRECRGNPLFINELVRHALLPTPPESLTLDRVLHARIGALPADARRLLEILAVSGGPLDAEVAAAASRVESRAIGLVAALRSARLIRVRRIDEHELLETYHDRIRDAVLRVLEPHELRTHHAELARSLERFAHADPEMLAVHLRESGDAQGAAGYALQAAQLAMEALAFDRASRLYRLVLDLRLGDDAQRGRIFERLGEALANAGRGHGAAQAYLEAAHISSGGERLELQRRAAEQLLRSGHVDQGLRVMGEVLDATGLKLASTPQRALLSLLWGRFLLRLSRLRFCERPTSLLASRERLQIDACWSVAMHIGTVDHFRAADFQARHLRLALRSGDPYRIARALAMEVAYSSTRGPKTAERTRRISQSVDQLAARVNDPQIYGLVYLSEGIAAYMQGYWKVALKHCRQAEAMLREQRSGIAWELDTAHLYGLLSLFYLGELQELRRQLPAVLKEAQERDDLTAQTNMRVRLAYLTFLLSDDIAAARHEVVEGIRPWSREGFHAQHYFEMHAHAEIALYANQPESAWDQITLAWPRLRASLLLRVHPIFIEAHYLRARAAIAMAQNSDGRTRVKLLQQAQRDAARLARAGASWGRASAFALKAAVANMRGDGPAAVDHLVAAERLYQAADMALHAAAVRWQRGTLSIQGRPLAVEEDGWPKGGVVQRPDRIAALLVPGFADRVSPA